MKILSIITLTILLTASAYALHKPAPVDEYPIHKDGGLIYNPLSKEAELTGQSAKYRNAVTVKKEIKLGQYHLQFDIPKSATAYDVVPIKYKLSWTDDKASFPVAVEATAFEDEKRRKGRNLHDLALPGKLDVKVDYLGSITAHMKPDARHIMKPDMSDTPKEYPPYDRKPFVRSGVVEAGDLVWFKFKYTNTGNTILDPDGIGGTLFNPEIYRKNEKGEWEFAGKPENYYIRDLEYLYPGESHDVWFHFRTTGPDATPQNFGLAPGQYQIRFRMLYRGEKGFNWLANMWEGYPMYTWEMPITVEKSARMAPVEVGKTTLTDAGDPDKITRWIHTYEEFMTAYDCHISKPEDKRSIEGTLHLQVAPWTKHVVIKLIGTEPVSIKSIAVPIDVESDSLQIKFDPDHQVNVIKNGLREPAIYSQTMSDMRVQSHLGPFPDQHLLARMREMMDCGINVVATTSMPWLYDAYNPSTSNHHADGWKYFLDLARKEGLWIEGWGAYPYDSGTVTGIINWVTGKNYNLPQILNNHYYSVSHSDPILAKARGQITLYQFGRWGDLFFQTEKGYVPISMEDSRGWLRQDFNVRYVMGPETVKAFQTWVKNKYRTIEAANTAWGSKYKSFDEVDPEANRSPGQFGMKWEYTDLSHPFHDWNQAMEDLDRFRTELRVKNYRETLAVVRRQVPGATIALRTEGANVIVSGIDPESTNPHLRHIYYSQRRCGIVADVMQKSGTVKFHSDYTTIPYTPTELRMLTRKSVEQGIIPVYLAQFDNMRDIAINEKYGTEYQTHYNLPTPKKGAMMHRLTALYPWFKAVYEEGGVPGILWEDYTCDGFATETQKREMRFFKQKLNDALNTPEAKRARGANINMPSQEWREKSKAVKSYNIDLTAPK
ncbi:MAG: beta-galactosidase [Armatimonadota bacterium]